METKDYKIGQLINFIPANNTLSREAKILKINQDGSLYCIENNKVSMELWNAGYEVSTTVYKHQIVK